MNLTERLCLALSLTLMAFGAGFACLPDAWIETTLGFNPDNGNDAVEILLAAVPFTLGLALGVEILRRRRVRARLMHRRVGAD